MDHAAFDSIQEKRVSGLTEIKLRRCRAMGTIFLLVMLIIAEVVAILLWSKHNPI